MLEQIERALCEANGCVWDLDPASESRQQWRRDVAVVRSAVIEECAKALESVETIDDVVDAFYLIDAAKAIRALAVPQ